MVSVSARRWNCLLLLYGGGGATSTFVIRSLYIQKISYLQVDIVLISTIKVHVHCRVGPFLSHFVRTTKAGITIRYDIQHRKVATRRRRLPHLILCLLFSLLSILILTTHFLYLCLCANSISAILLASSLSSCSSSSSFGL